jgi:alanine dehydrogenase
MLVLDAADVCRALPMADAIEAMKGAFAALSSGRAAVPDRICFDVKPHDGVSIIMPAFIDDGGGRALAVKVISLFDHNRERGLPRIQAAVLALELDTGRPVALLEGATLTAIRTGAASAVATDLMARPDCRTAAILGGGVQGRTQLEAVCTVRPIETVWVYDPAAGAVQAFIDEMAGQGPIPADLRPAADPREAVAEADVVCAATTSHTPVFADADLKPGAHVNAVGSYQPHVQEVPAETVVRAWLVVDSRRTALAETGDLIQPIRARFITADHVRADLGELVLGKAKGRTSDDQVTLFKAVGVAVQDAAAARAALARAKQLGLGQTVRW